MEGGRNPQIRRGQILNIPKYKSWVGGQGEGGGGSLLIYDKSENESQKHNAAKVDISCPNVSLNAFNCILSSLKINWER